MDSQKENVDADATASQDLEAKYCREKSNKD